MPPQGRHSKPPGQQAPPLTHFLAFPLVTPTSKSQLEDSTKQFGEIVSPENTAGNNQLHVHPKAIRPLGTLHCTLGIMSLDSERLDEAIKTLHDIDIPKLLQESSPETPSSPLKITLQGLKSMHPPTQTSILYAVPHDPTNRLYAFSLALRQPFLAKNLLASPERELIPHATIVNTTYAREKKRPKRSAAQSRIGLDEGEMGEVGHGVEANSPLKLDARGLMERFGDFVWAERVVLDRVAICKMGSKEVFDGEGRVIGVEYEEVATIELPQ